QVGIEGPLGPDRAEYLARPADLLRLRVFEDKDVKVVGRSLIEPLETGLAALELILQRHFFRRQVGEPAAGQLGKIVESAQVGLAGRADAEAHLSPPASRRMVSADRAARSARLSTIRNSSML